MQLPNWSLRTRLLLATLALVGLGLFAASAATYALLSSSLIGRVDEQLEDAGLPAAELLLRPGGRALGRSGPAQRAFKMPGLQFPHFRGHRGGGEDLGVTFFQLLDPAGNVISSRSFGFGQAEAAPRLPEALPGSLDQDDHYSRRFFTTSSQGSSDVRFRILATSLGPQRGTLVAAFPLTEVDATLRRLLLVEGLVGLLVLAGVGLLAGWLVRVGLRPLTRMEETAAAIAGGDLSRRVEPADTRTEVGRLGRALNHMLERIEAAFAERRASEERLRRFVADASHELRTPLTSIRGYAELFRRGANAHPEDLAKSMRRIEEEAARMGTLVEELLLLAKFDQGPVLKRAPIDLTKLASDAVEDARAVQPNRPIETEWSGAALVDGDQARLRQVVANLLANALEHTPEPTPVTVRVWATDSEAVLEVADRGPGLDEEQAGRVFHRFFRVDPARAREKGGAGLGLSIVESIVEAHGGRVWVETAPGDGARFLVALPRVEREAR
jgi:two-component system OmpR family sensor kinase